MVLKYFLLAITIILLISCADPERKIVDAPSKTLVRDSCHKNDSSVTGSETSLLSEITCPQCGFKKTETMPTDVCQLKYTCEKCRTELRPKPGDCCVFCTYGTKKCPSMQ